MRESTSVFQIRTINRSKLEKGQVSVDRFPDEVTMRISFYSSLFLATEYFRNNSLHSSIIKIYLDVIQICEIIDISRFVFIFVMRSLFH